MNEEIMIFNSPRQLKDWLKNKEITEVIPSNNLLNYYMMERLLERISISKYNESFIFKGGFLVEIINIKNIHSSGKYEYFRITIEAKFLNLKEYLKIDFTTGDMIVPREIEYKYRLMFEDRMGRGFFKINLED